ncbi:very short patch repair endonuclease [Pedobacter sp. AW31-3R]|uniref:very short patch repair endonuclease n=1 Tax=Pedobacter sp. AW31-3R TaxID=3445781 RepID=UPI003F9F78A0
MSRIRSKNTKPELLVRKYLHSKGFRYRLHNKKLPGKPDIVLKKYQTVIFVHGCFWHGHQGCPYFVIPKSRTEWWVNKINGNILRGSKSNEELRREGWNIIEIWECDLKKKQVESTLRKLSDALLSIK